MRNRILLGLVTTTMVFAGSAAAQGGAEKSRTDIKASTSKENSNNTASELPSPRPATNNPNYLIGADDELNVSIWREPDISRSVPVRPDGKISLPLVNDVQAVGLTPMQLGAEITTRLKKFIADPQVTIIVARINSQRIFILGEVPRAGAYPMLPNMTVLGALSLAGGVTPFAKQSKIHVLRVEDGKQQNLPFSYKDAIHGLHPEQNIILKPGDTIVVP
jgi:polysaccharide biosynthesis/export protein